MQAKVLGLNGEEVGTVELPGIFSEKFRKDIVLRALLAEQSRMYQPQGRDPLAGLRTSATYVGRYNTYRTLRHMGVAIRPRQKLAKGAMGEVRRIPSARKGRRAHPSKVEKRLEERINRKEYEKALAMAIAATVQEEARKRSAYAGQLPIVVDDSIEKIKKTKELLNVLEKIGLKEELERSHKPRIKQGMRRKVRKRYFRKSAVIIAKDIGNLEKSARNIPGIDVATPQSLSVSVLAPGGMPRLAVWTVGAIKELEKGVSR